MKLSVISSFWMFGIEKKVSATYMRAASLTASCTLISSNFNFSISVFATDLPLPTAHPW
jgi:hypothetical protein